MVLKTREGDLVFRREFKTEIDINAPVESIWKVLIDLAAYPDWNPMIRWASGELRPGARLTVRFEPEGYRGQTFRPKLITVIPNRELRWQGWPRFPGIFDMEHYWIINEAPGGPPRLLHGVVLYGVIAPIGIKALERASRILFERMNLAHKERAEGRQV